MKKGILILASFLLLFNGAGALYGGLNLMTHPDGSSMHLSLSWLQHSGFDDFLIPGILLFVTNGLFSLFIFATLLFKYRNTAWLIICQGAILSGWIIIQVIIIRTIVPLHVVLAIFGLLLIVCGYMLRTDPLLKNPR
jgi:hypothetical protein